MERSREYALVLLRKARDDGWMLGELLDNPEAPDWGLGFHAQQAVEKAIKAVLVAKAVSYPQTHDLRTLLNLVEDSGLSGPPSAGSLAELTPYGAPLRYDEPGDGAGGRRLDRAVVFCWVQDVLAWAESMVGKTEGPGR